MLAMLVEHLERWKTSPRKWEAGYIWHGFKGIVLTTLQDRRYAKTRGKLLTPVIEAEYVQMLFDADFKSSVAQAMGRTCLDVARLANLWNVVRLCGPGIFLEVGTFQGGTALHICNALGRSDAPFYCFDPFEKGGFENMTELDRAFKPDDYTSTRYQAVADLLAAKPNARVIQGFFPAAAEGLDLRDIAFCHLDVDTYNATRQCLEYLAPRLASRGLIVVDDFGHSETPGVNKAVSEFLTAHPSFLMIPMFPVQALLVPQAPARR